MWVGPLLIFKVQVQIPNFVIVLWDSNLNFLLDSLNLKKSSLTCKNLGKTKALKKVKFMQKKK
jgi:hypothetical protein